MDVSGNSLRWRTVFFGEMDLFIKMNAPLIFVMEGTNTLIFYIFENGTENSAEHSADVVLNFVSYKCN